jgi:hypothetical protein
MACPKCGCRMLTKVGRAKTMLICSDCGHPHDPALDKPGSNWRQLSSVLLLVLISGAALTLSLLSDFVVHDQSPLQEAPERQRSK